jgi:hypothetical protein
MKTTASRSIFMICVKSRTSEMATREELLDGFGNWYEVEPNTGCWLWLRAANTQEYGNLHLDGSYALAHRALYELTFGQIPEGMVVMHKCDTPCCVNPDHLMIGTKADNSRDMAQKGRWRNRAKLTIDQVREIRGAEGLLHREIAERFGVARSIVTRIKNGSIWKEV